MSRGLTVTYDAPADPLPYWTPKTERATPCAYRPRIDIYCTQGQLENQCALSCPPVFPWHDANLHEIHVESRKAYEILKKVCPEDFSGTVRIMPPVPRRPMDCEKLLDVVFFVNGMANEYDLAKNIATSLRGVDMAVVNARMPDFYALADLAVFVNWSSETEQQLQRALEYGCKVLASNAGAAEEYLTRCATPGRWHVAKSWKADEWVQMILDLMGMENEMYQTQSVDLTPYVVPFVESDQSKRI